MQNFTLRSESEKLLLTVSLTASRLRHSSDRFALLSFIESPNLMNAEFISAIFAFFLALDNLLYVL